MESLKTIRSKWCTILMPLKWNSKKLTATKMRVLKSMDKLELNESAERFLKKIPDFLKEKYVHETVDFKVLVLIPILYQAWEMDEWAVVISLDKVGNILIHSDHGSLCQVESPKDFLHEQVALCQRTIKLADSAIGLL